MKGMLSNIQKLYLFIFLYSLSFFGAVSIPFYLDWAKVSYTQIFLLQSWFMLWLFILEVPTGAVADKFGRNVSLCLSGLAVALGSFAYSQIPNFYVFLVAEFLFALGISALSGADKAMLYDSLKETEKSKESKHFFSRYALFGTMGLVVAFPIGSIVAGSNILPYPDTLPLTFLLTAIPVFLSALVALSIKEPKRPMPTENVLRLGIKGINYLRKHKVLRSFAIDMTLISATTFFIFWFYQPLLLNAGMEIKLLGFVAAAFNLFGVLLLARTKEIEKVFGIKNVLFLTALVPALAFIGLSLFGALWFVLPAVFLVAGLKLLRQPLFDHYMNNFIRSGERATVLSAVSMLSRIILVIFYPIIGFLSDISINHALAALGILTLIFAFFAKVDERHLEG